MDMLNLLKHKSFTLAMSLVTMPFNRMEDLVSYSTSGNPILDKLQNYWWNDPLGIEEAPFIVREAIERELERCRK